MKLTMFHLAGSDSMNMFVRMFGGDTNEERIEMSLGIIAVTLAALAPMVGSYDELLRRIRAIEDFDATLAKAFTEYEKDQAEQRAQKGALS